MAGEVQGRGWLTAYEPFLGRPENQSQEVVRRVLADERLPAGWGGEFWPAVLPELADRTRATLDRRPRVWLAVGEAREEGVPQLETVARNRWDLQGDQAAAAGGPEHGTFELGGPDQIRAHWPAAALADFLTEQGFSIELSEDAGSHCCNGVLWWATRMAAAGDGPRPWMGFLHLPRQVERRAEQAELIVAAVGWLDRQFGPRLGG